MAPTGRGLSEAVAFEGPSWGLVSIRRLMSSRDLGRWDLESFPAVFHTF